MVVMRYDRHVLLRGMGGGARGGCSRAPEKHHSGHLDQVLCDVFDDQGMIDDNDQTG